MSPIYLVMFLFTQMSQVNDFVTLQQQNNDFAYDMRYATDNNFLNTAVYSCDNCLLRREVADSLIKANAYFISKGYRIKLFDCYRPLDVQKKMWEILPDPRYVANPAKGSMHNRGGAVDLTLIRLDGTEVDMGTDFDHFGEEAHHAYADLPAMTLENRVLLKEGLMKFGFKPISTEWWHYNFSASNKYPISDFITKCD